MFCGISNDREQNETNKSLGEIPVFGDFFNGFDEEFSRGTDKECHSNQETDSKAIIKHSDLGFFVLAFFVGVQMMMGSQLEEQVENIDTKKNNLDIKIRKK